MNRIERLTGILLALQASPRTAQQLAARFDVSRRTILRDIDALCQMRVPIVALPGPNGGYRLPPDYSVPPIHFSSEEATIVLLALSSFGAPEQSVFGTPHHLAREKLLAALRGDVKSQAISNLTHLAVMTDDDGTNAAILEILRAAARAEEWVDIDYRGSRGATSRAILPQLVYLSGQRWYVDAVDALRRAMRTFRVSRIAAIRRVPPPSGATTIIDTANQRAGSYHHPTNPEIDVTLTERGTALALDHPDFRDHVTVHEGQGILQFRCPETELPYYARELLRFGVDATVRGPAALTSQMRAIVEELRGHLQNGDEHLSPIPS